MGNPWLWATYVKGQTPQNVQTWFCGHWLQSVFENGCAKILLNTHSVFSESARCLTSWAPYQKWWRYWKQSLRCWKNSCYVDKAFSLDHHVNCLVHLCFYQLSNITKLRLWVSLTQSWDEDDYLCFYLLSYWLLQFPLYLQARHPSGNLHRLPIKLTQVQDPCDHTENLEHSQAPFYIRATTGLNHL